MKRFTRIVKKPLTAVIALLAIVLFGFSSCLDPFSMEPGRGIKINVDANVRIIDSAVLWVLNATKSVDVTDILITRDNNATYEKQYTDKGPKAGSSLASYHDATEDIYTITVTYEKNPGFDSSSFPEITDYAGTKSVQIQMPRYLDYSVYLYRKTNGDIDLAYEVGDNLPNDAHDEDQTKPPQPGGSSEVKNPLIIKNLTKNATIETVEFTSLFETGSVIYADTIEHGRAGALILKQGTYNAVVNYSVPDSDSSKPDKKLSTIPDVIQVHPSTHAQSYNTLYAYFYLAKNGGHFITQIWPPLTNEPAEETIPPESIEDFSGVKIRVNNKMASGTVYAIGVRAQDTDFEYEKVVDSDTFSPKGEISMGLTKTAFFDEEEFVNEGLYFDNSPYTIVIYMIKYEMGKWNGYHFPLLGRNLLRGNIYDIEISEDLVKSLVPDWEDDDGTGSITPPPIVGGCDCGCPDCPDCEDGCTCPSCDDDDPKGQLASTAAHTFAAGDKHTVAITKDRKEILIWGNNAHGQLGNGSTKDELSPIRVPMSNLTGQTDLAGKPLTWEAVSAGHGYTIALRSDGKLYSWGQNNRGQLGINTSDSKKNAPTQVPGTDWVAVSAGNHHVAAIKADGSLWTWGYNNYGQLGIGNKNTTKAPQRVGTDNDWIAVSAGEDTTLGIRGNIANPGAGGTLWSWGSRWYGESGDGTSRVDGHTRPIQIMTSKSDWVVVSSREDHHGAIDKNGGLWMWGYDHGRLGLGTGKSERSTPTKVGGDEWVDLSQGWYHTIATKKDGSLWAWGQYNDRGEIGDGTLTKRTTPVRIAEFGWKHVEAGIHHSVAIRSDGTLWTWGLNSDGQLGVGDKKNRRSPNQVTLVPRY